LAGSEKRGPEHADANLFHNRLTIVTPTSSTDQEALAQVTSFWEALGSRVRLMTPGAHDHALAQTSHLPHLLAATLAGLLTPENQELAASGFRDTTRVAAGDPDLWTAIFAHNQPAVLQALGPLMDRLSEFQKLLLNQDWPGIHARLTQAKKVRDALGS
jgi:prephenate dehydrogenase